MHRASFLFFVGLLLVAHSVRADPPSRPNTGAVIDRALVLTAEAARLYVAGRFRDALPLAEHAVLLRESALAPNHPDVARSLNNLAVVLVALGQYERALPLHERALRIRESTFGHNHPDVASSLNNLAATFRAMGQYDRALPLVERALRIRETTLGANGPDVANSLDNLADTLLAMGRYERAVSLEERALLIRESLFGPSHPDVAQSLNNLARLFVSLGEYERALPLYERSLRIREVVLGSNHPDVAQSLNNLAQLFVSMGQYDRARPLFERTLNIQESALGPNHPAVAETLYNFADLLRATGQPTRAVSFLQRALEIRERALGANHSEVAFSLNQFALVLSSIGQVGRAIGLETRAIAIWEHTFGLDHAFVSTGLNNLAKMYFAAQQYERALPLLERALLIDAASLRHFSRRLLEQRVMRLMPRIQDHANALISLAVEHPSDAQVRQLALEVTFLVKGRGQDESSATMAALRRSPTPEDQSTLAQWSSLRRQLAALQPTAIEDRTRLEDMIRSTEERLAESTSALREEDQRTDVAALIARVAQRLPASSALIEVVAFSPFHARAHDQAARRPVEHYAAFVLLPDGSHSVTDLGERAALDASAQQLRDSVLATRATEEPVAEAGRALFGRLFAAIASSLPAGTNRLLLAPDGPLHRIPLHLSHDGQHWLADRYMVSYLTSGRDLLRERSTFDRPGPPTAVIASRYSVPTWNITGLQFDATILPRLISGIRVLNDEGATEAALEHLDAPAILHIAAHSEYLSAAEAGTEDPMQRGLLILGDVSPARVPRSDGQDGLATPAELMAMNLRGTRLVVLSTTDLSTGGISASDGVPSLRRALLLAGAEALVTPLWNSEPRTRLTFLIALYEGLRAGISSAGALARAVRIVRERDPDPFAWAPFVFVGYDDVIDWGATTQH